MTDKKLAPVAIAAVAATAVFGVWGMETAAIASSTVGALGLFLVLWFSHE